MENNLEALVTDLSLACSSADGLAVDACLGNEGELDQQIFISRIGTLHLALKYILQRAEALEEAERKEKQAMKVATELPHETGACNQSESLPGWRIEAGQ